MATPATCSPEALIADTPCFQCLSQSELLMVIVLALMEANNFTVADDLQTLLETTACANCSPDGQRLQAIAAVLANTFLTRDTIEQIKTDGACLPCMQPGQLKSLIVYLFCLYFTTPN
jgi:hypothetical protein